MTWIYFSLPRFCYLLTVDTWSKTQDIITLRGHRSLSRPTNACSPRYFLRVNIFPPPFFVFQSRTEHTQHHIFYSAHTHIYIYIFPPFFSFLKDQSSRGFIGNRERIIASPFLFFFFFFSLSFESRHASPSLQSDGSDGSNDPEYLNTLFDQREASFLPASDIYIYLYDFLFILFYLLLFLSISHLFFFVFLFWYSSHDASLHSRGIFFFKSILIFSSNTPGG